MLVHPICIIFYCVLILITYYNIMATYIDRYGNELDAMRPYGAHAEHMQPAKTINAESQKRMREDKRRIKMTKEYGEIVVERNTISEILKCNTNVENELKAKAESGSFSQATVADFFSLSPSSKLENCIHVRKFKALWI